MTDSAGARWQLSLTVDGPLDAPTLVLGHSLGSSHVMWDDVVAELVPRVRVVRYDLPGHGGSPAAPVAGRLSMDQLVAALVRTLDAAGIGAFHLGGLSLGGLTALCVAEAVPHRIPTLTVMSSGPVNLSPQAWIDKAAAVRAHGTASLVDATMDRWFSAPFSRGSGSAWVQRIRQVFLDCSDQGYAQCCEVLASADARPGLSSLPMPVTLVSAELDAALDWQGADALAQTLRAGSCPDVQVVRVTGAKHMSAVEQPHRVASALLDRVGA